MVDFHVEADFVGKAALLKIRDQGPKRARMGFVISGAPVQGFAHSMDVKTRNGQVLGLLSEFIYSPRFTSNIEVQELPFLNETML
ncbi:hypothetical protein [Pseudorhodobacter turbinis]|uniref:hypothetical protein n=1 Tax=Pseudorhodobacter turbinis TaxID=2500533 RepID=UPI00143D0089|nr:hypothetical protein [Pseudorhodobacter turbinis]